MITFRYPFMLSSVNAEQPAGTYRLVTEEEEIPGLSFVAFRRTATMLHLPAVSEAEATASSREHGSLEWSVLLFADGRG